MISLVEGTAAFDPGDGGEDLGAELENPAGAAAEGAGNLYVADPASHRVRKAGRAGRGATVAGNGFRGLSGDGGPRVEGWGGNSPCADEPVVLSQCVTVEGGDPVVPRQRAVRDSSLEMRLQEEQTLDGGGRIQETAGYIALGPRSIARGYRLIQSLRSESPEAIPPRALSGRVEGCRSEDAAADRARVGGARHAISVFWLHQRTVLGGVHPRECVRVRSC